MLHLKNGSHGGILLPLYKSKVDMIISHVDIIMLCVGKINRMLT